MDILFKNIDENLIFNPTTDFKPNAGWEENFQSFEKETLRSIINPAQNFETIRYIHEPYELDVSEVTTITSDIWFYFYFLDNAGGFTKGLDYSLVGISSQENMIMTKQSVKSFFRLEFYTTPDRETQKLVLAKDLSLPLGQKVFYTELKHNIHIPVFTGNNYKNSENMYLFWFPDDTVFTGMTFYMTARFFNAEDGTITRFMNNTHKTLVKDSDDLYYKVTFNRAEHTYDVYEYDSISKGTIRKGKYSAPINFYEMTL